VAFDTAIRLYYTTEEVRACNFDRLVALNQPIKRLTGQHRGRNAIKASREEADNLSPELLVCIGARIMLTSNL
jgi:hypothetical protein